MASIINARIDPMQTLHAQLKSAGTSPKVQVQSPNTQGIPQVTSNVSVRKNILSATQARLSVSFAHNPGDLYTTGFVIYLKQGTANPVQVAAGDKSPITFTTTRTKVPSTIIVQSVGKWGSTAVGSSPVGAISLA